jgi:hypothetical protein
MRTVSVPETQEPQKKDLSNPLLTGAVHCNGCASQIPSVSGMMPRTPARQFGLFLSAPKAPAVQSGSRVPTDRVLAASVTSQGQSATCLRPRWS